MKTAFVTIYDVATDGLPRSNCLIIADDGQEWHILTYDNAGAAYGWEYDEPVQFDRWAYLNDLFAAEQGEETGQLFGERHTTIALPILGANH